MMSTIISMSTKDRENAEKYFKFIYAQLMLVQTFVDDMLDLHQIKDGAFSLRDAVFDPNEILDMVVDIFKPQADAKTLKLFWSIDKELVLPADGSTNMH